MGALSSLGFGAPREGPPSWRGLTESSIRREMVYLSPKSSYLKSQNQLQLIRGLFSKLLKILNTFSFTSVTS